CARRRKPAGEEPRTPRSVQPRMSPCEREEPGREPLSSASIGLSPSAHSDQRGLRGRRDLPFTLRTTRRDSPGCDNIASWKAHGILSRFLPRICFLHCCSPSLTCSRRCRKRSGPNRYQASRGQCTTSHCTYSGWTSGYSLANATVSSPRTSTPEAIKNWSRGSGLSTTHG